MSEVPKYSIITQHSTPVMLRSIFDLIESRYVRRSRYIEDVSTLIRDVNRLSLLSDYKPFIDSEGNITFTTPEG